MQQKVLSSNINILFILKRTICLQSMIHSFNLIYLGMKVHEKLIWTTEQEKFGNFKILTKKLHRIFKPIL